MTRIDNSDYPASLERRKIYESIVDGDAAKHGQLRVIDESGEDYLYPAECFVEANLPESIRAAVAQQPNHALHPTLDPARLALPLQAACVKCG
ncbi:MAG: hypothetical protein U5K38_14470 [Woeseiaceae bacterium]|nr:hypothetical protein [Woeseiaceae bacterium]